MSDVADLRRAAHCVYIAVEASVADDLSAKLTWAADEIERLRVMYAKSDAENDELRESEARLRAALKAARDYIEAEEYGPMQYIMRQIDDALGALNDESAR